MTTSILELRVALTAADYDALLRFYTDVLGLDIGDIWTNEGARGVIFDMGRATLEVLDDAAAASVDQIEAGRRVSGPVRLALQVPNLDAALQRARAHGATLVHEPVVTPWRDYNARLEAPGGMQITLFQPLDKESP